MLTVPSIKRLINRNLDRFAVNLETATIYLDNSPVSPSEIVKLLTENKSLPTGKSLVFLENLWISLLSKEVCKGLNDIKFVQSLDQKIKRIS